MDNDKKHITSLRHAHVFFTKQAAETSYTTGACLGNWLDHICTSLETHQLIGTRNKSPRQSYCPLGFDVAPYRLEYHCYTRRDFIN